MLLGVVVSYASRTRVEPVATPSVPERGRAIVEEVNWTLADAWELEEFEPPAVADDLTILRRLSLALHGTIPSLEEIRQFEADTEPDRLTRWTRRLLDDPRFGNYFAERLARPLVGADAGPFILFRRDRFTAWLAERLMTDEPWDATVRHLIADEGLWTDTPSVNFVTMQFTNDEKAVDASRLTARTVRAFLGQRIDCAQCHDHPFEQWKQSQFEGLAAHYAQPSIGIGGMKDNPETSYVLQDAETLEDRTIDPALPFGDEWLVSTAALTNEDVETMRPRRQLALWVTSEENHRFDRAIVNRVWTLMMGRPVVPSRPVDDLPDPVDPIDRAFGDEHDEWAVLDLLADDFRSSGRHLHRLIETIAASEAFRATSQSDHIGSQRDRAEDVWAVRPLVRLRPEQMIGSMLQAGSIRTIDRDSHLAVRFLRLVRENDFVRDYGDAGEAELDDRSATIPQALLRMNGKLADELSEASPMTAAGRLAMVESDPTRFVETAYLICLTRRPTDAEREYFVGELTTAAEEGPEAREQAVQDVFWTLFNSPEFSWVR